MYHDAMESVDPIALLAQLAMGITLAACTGLRAFLPPLALGVASRAGLLELPANLSWLGSNPVLTVLSVAVVVELLGDKVPVVDHFLDGAGLVLRPAAGALVGAVPLMALVSAGPEGPADGPIPWVAGLSGAVLGGSLSTGVHLAKSHLRLGSTLLTAGLVNPLISLLEDLVSFVIVALAVIVPLAGFAILAGVAFALVVFMRRRRRRLSPQGI